jgi:osmotically-inducible protein OsmY
MKTILVLLLLGFVIGTACWVVYKQDERPAPVKLAGKIAGDARAAVTEVKAAVEDRAEDWKLTPASIRAELAKTGRIVRTNAKALGEHIDDARIITVLKGKFVVEKNLSTFAISVSCTGGDVVLTGSVASEEYIARAVQLALQTAGVHQVVSRLEVKA